MRAVTDLEPSAGRTNAPDRRLRTRTFDNPAAALGIAVSYLMTRPAFARLAFGHWTRVLVGQINRGHYVFAYDADQVVGFAGWALAGADDAEAWLDGDAGARADGGRTGDCIVVNAWAANSPEAHRLLVDHVRRVAAGKRAVYAKRIYRDRRSPTRLRVNHLVQQHLATAAERPDREPKISSDQTLGDDHGHLQRNQSCVSVLG